MKNKKLLIAILPLLFLTGWSIKVLINSLNEPAEGWRIGMALCGFLIMFSLSVLFIRKLSKKRE